MLVCPINVEPLKMQVCVGGGVGGGVLCMKTNVIPK